jgi:hypothetical protein
MTGSLQGSAAAQDNRTNADRRKPEYRLAATNI